MRDYNKKFIHPLRFTSFYLVSLCSPFSPAASFPFWISSSAFSALVCSSFEKLCFSELALLPFS
jgi:hypothetical protein